MKSWQDLATDRCGSWERSQSPKVWDDVDKRMAVFLSEEEEKEEDISFQNGIYVEKYSRQKQQTWESLALNCLEYAPWGESGTSHHISSAIWDDLWIP